MFETKIVHFPSGKHGHMETNGLLTCTAIIVLMRSSDGERYCLMSHIPYSIGNEVNFAMSNAICQDEQTQKEALIILPALPSSREEEVIEAMLLNVGVPKDNISVHTRTNTFHYDRTDGLVEVDWPTDTHPSVQFLGKNQSGVCITVNL